MRAWRSGAARGLRSSVPDLRDPSRPDARGDAVTIGTQLFTPRDLRRFRAPMSTATPGAGKFGRYRTVRQLCPRTPRSGTPCTTRRGSATDCPTTSTRNGPDSGERCGVRRTGPSGALGVIRSGRLRVADAVVQGSAGGLDDRRPVDSGAGSPRMRGGRGGDQPRSTGPAVVLVLRVSFRARWRASGPQDGFGCAAGEIR